MPENDENIRLNVSLPVAWVQVLRELQEKHGLASSEEVLVLALRHLYDGEAYREAGASWEGSQEAHLWEQTSGDGLMAEDAGWPQEVLDFQGDPELEPFEAHRPGSLQDVEE